MLISVYMDIDRCLKVPTGAYRCLQVGTGGHRWQVLGDLQICRYYLKYLAAWWSDTNMTNSTFYCSYYYKYYNLISYPLIVHSPTASPTFTLRKLKIYCVLAVCCQCALFLEPRPLYIFPFGVKKITVVNISKVI